jgi:hypothetical protein
VKLYDLSVETSVLSAGILLTVDQDYSTFFILCNSIWNWFEYKKLSIIFKWFDAIAGICVLFTLKKSTIWYVEVIDVN